MKSSSSSDVTGSNKALSKQSISSTVFNFFAVRHMQLAETVSIMFAAPFVVTALAGPLLNEWAGLRRWMAIIVGFIGVLVVTRPGLGEMHWAAILSVCSMLSYALYALTTRMPPGTTWKLKPPGPEPAQVDAHLILPGHGSNMARQRPQ